MAMTKKEKEREDALVEALSSSRALGWRSFVPALLPIPKYGQTPYPLGFLHNLHSGEIYYASTSASAHVSSTEKKYVEDWANGRTSSGGSQGPRVLFFTRRDALCDLRMKLQEKYGRHLAQIDAAIEKESST